MRFSEHYGSGRFGLSFELFPPKTPEGEASLFEHVARLVEFKPSCITCTYGAGGSTRGKTLEIISQVRRMFGVDVATHLTCVGGAVDQLRAYLSEAHDLGIENVVALRGDPPRGEEAFQAVAGGFQHANELVALIGKEFPTLGVAVAGYPEKHKESPSFEADLTHLKRKVDSGADVVFTQLFYDNQAYFRFRDRCERIGLAVPIVPGLLPMTNLAQVRRITALCGASLPEAMVADLAACGEDEARQFDVGIEFAARQSQQLIDGGAPGIHYYVLNRSQAATAVLNRLTWPGTR